MRAVSTHAHGTHVRFSLSHLMQYLQEERFLLRHMEREEPQGEENGEPMLQCQMQQAVASAAARYIRIGIRST